jgi:YD repeat-containing protein
MGSRKMLASIFQNKSGRIVPLVILLTITACNDSTYVEVVPDEVEEAPTTLLADVVYEYDSTNRLTAVRYSNGDVMRYTYDEAGNILSVEMDKAE